MKPQLKGNGQYYRFNVAHGLEDFGLEEEEEEEEDYRGIPTL